MLRHAFFPEFKGNATFLLWGGQEDMTVLREAFTRVANGERELFLSTLPAVRSVDGSAITIHSVSRGSGFRRAAAHGLSDWALDQETALDFADKVAVLEMTASAGHQYLEASPRDDAMVMVAAGEYPDDLAP